MNELMDTVHIVEIAQMIMNTKRRCIMYNMECVCGKALENTVKGLEGLHLLQW
jgi:hypothetical protein